MTRESLTPAEKIVRVADALTRRGIPFAFGGALARNYYAEPRLTTDIDIGIFLPAEAYPRVLSAFSGLFPITDADHVAEVIRRDAQVRLHWDHISVDVFFSYDPFHEASAGRMRRVPYGDTEIPILAPEDIILHKITFSRAKDWRDVADILFSQRDTIDIPYIRRWLAYFFPPDETRPATDQARYDSRIKLFDDLVRAIGWDAGNERM